MIKYATIYRVGKFLLSAVSTMVQTVLAETSFCRFLPKHTKGSKVTDKLIQMGYCLD